MTAYCQGEYRPLIQVERKETRSWLVWNWDKGTWDTLTEPITADFVDPTPGLQMGEDLR